MKFLTLVALTLFSFSSFSQVCELSVALSDDAATVKLFLTDKDCAEEDSELVIQWTGGNPEKKNCDELFKDLSQRDLKVDIDGNETPIILVRESSED